MINLYVLSQVRIVCAKILTIKKLTLRLLRRHPGLLLGFRLLNLFFLRFIAIAHLFARICLRAIVINSF